MDRFVISGKPYIVVLFHIHRLIKPETGAIVFSKGASFSSSSEKDFVFAT